MTSHSDNILDRGAGQTGKRADKYALKKVGIWEP